MSELLSPDDAGTEYMDQRATGQAAKTVADFMQQMQAEEAPGGQDVSGETPAPDQQAPAAAPPAADERSFGERVLSGAGAVASDVGRGIVEAPKQMLGGVSDMVHQVFTAADHLGDWLNENVADLRIPVPDTGVEAIDHLIQEPATTLAGRGPGSRPERTAEGRVIVYNPDGSISTERTITVTDPRLNAGKPTNIPSIYGGNEVSEDEAIRIVVENKGIDPDTGQKLPGFKSVAEAEAAAKKRSNALGELYARQIQPEVPRGESVTGGFIREATRFLTGLKVATKVVGPGLARIPAGAVTDFVALDPDAKRLADLWVAAGLPENELTGYLESDPSDSELEKRFKNALEGAGLGVLTEGVFRGAKYLRNRYAAARAAREAGVGAIDELATAPRVKPEDFAALGDVGDDTLVKVTRKGQAGKEAGKLAAAEKVTETGVPDAVAARAVKGAAKSGAKLAAKETLGEPEITINFARMDGPEELKRVFRETAEAFSGSIDEARRGKIGLDETARMAERLGMSPADLISRTRGMAYNAEQIVAAGKVMDASTAKLFEVAEKAAAPTASAVDQFMFRKMLAVHHAVQSEFLGAVAESGRALNAIKIAQRGGGAETARAIDDLIQATGGAQTSQEMARRLMILRAAGTPEGAMAGFVRKGWAATTTDAVKEYWINALLSSPTTHIVNTASNSMVVTMQMYERLAAEGISAARGAAPGQGVAAGESAAMLYGLMSGWKDSFRMAWKSLKTGETEMGKMLGKLDLPRRFNRGAARAISSTAMNLDEAGAVGRSVDYVGAVISSPGRALVAEDEFFKSIGYRMELHAQAFRQAASEGLQGQALGERIGQILADAPENIRMAAADAALYNTFTNQTEWFGQTLMKLRSAGGAANPLVFIMPFVRTPVNIARYAFERSIAAPLVRQWRADIAAGGARADLALARMGTGTGIMMLAADLAMSGMVTGRGPKDQGEREALLRQGRTPYSIRVGDKWYSYNRADPFGMTMGFAADFTEAMTRGEIDPDDVDEWTELMAQMIASVAQVSVSKTYLRGMANFFEMMADPSRYAPGEINQFVGSFVPSGVAMVERMIDPVSREVFDPFDAVVNRLPGLSERLIPKRDLWGKEIKPESGLGPVYDTLSPIYVSQVRDSPIDREISRLVADVRRIKKKSSFQGVDVNFRDWPKVYDAYVRLAGNDAKHPAWGMGAKDFLDAVVTGKHPLSEVYDMKSDGKDGGKAEFIRNTVRQYRDLAQREIMDMPEFSQFRDWLEGRRGEERARRAPAGLGIELPQ